MKDGIGDLMRQAKQMQENLQKAQEDLNRLEVTGQAGAGMVSVVMTGRHQVRRVSIDDSLWGDDKDMVEDLLTAALNDAVQKIDTTIQEQFSGVAGGLNLPAGMKLPF